MFKLAIILSAMLISGCGNAFKTVEVHILPFEYRVGDVKSALATPAVDEVVRLNPAKVHISMCHTTPNAKAIQFNAELQARLKAKITGGFFETCPEI